MARLPGPLRPVEFVKWTARFARDPYHAAFDLHREYGPVVQLGIWPMRFVYLFGREANEFVLASGAEHFLWAPAFKVLEPISGPTSILLSDGDEHRRRRRLVQPAFGTRRLQAQVSVMQAEADRMIDGWQPGADVDAYSDGRTAIRRLVIRLLFGEHLGSRADELGDALQPLLDNLHVHPVRMAVQVDLPFTRLGRGMRAKRTADRIVLDEVDRRRRTGSVTDGDVLSMLLAARDDDGNGLSDDELRDQVISLVAAGFDTTAAMVGWTVYAALRHPGVWDSSRAEVESVVGGNDVTFEHLQRMPYLDGVVHESLRLHPAVFVSPRVVGSPFEFAGHRVDTGETILFSPMVTQRLSELWPRPEHFDPLRWDPNQPGFEEPEPYSFVVFGGGYRRCIGFAMATLELKVFLARLVARTDLALLRKEVAPTGYGTVVPKGGVPVRVEARR